ncbi:alpha/beta-hydrolase [Basidiobolus meristosporus CBS 931.73]|uniref:Alpha/beta-hydrolase n=1 Tax=Basidiobolus meristosporus CBS 931.73 TaxID=1314790 RepID=A0A1Y1WXV8_9FUNG|nr:alpha/beta-hydrolase [Basidiobolus meristosporus CBS 931.73]|eukprot:ORX78026.1 alpha/beta-hydrolase [Basidiobolus meristosporus CBS 931.73]
MRGLLVLSVHFLALAFAIAAAPLSKPLVPVGPDVLKTLKLHANYAQAAYCSRSDLQSNIQGCNKKLENVKLVSYLYNPDADSAGFVGIDRKAKKVILSFRGSVSGQNWVSNGNAKDQYKLVVTGHSLGGGIATLAALDLLMSKHESQRSHLLSNRLFLHTYGEPAIGNAAFVQFLLDTFRAKSAVSNIARVTNKSDGVVLLSPVLLTDSAIILKGANTVYNWYKNAVKWAKDLFSKSPGNTPGLNESGKNVHVDLYMHHPGEIHITENESTVYCKDIASGHATYDHRCSGSLWGNLCRDHLKYWDIKFADVKVPLNLLFINDRCKSR